MKDWLQKLRKKRDGTSENARSNAPQRQKVTREQTEEDIEAIRKNAPKISKTRDKKTGKRGTPTSPLTFPLMKGKCQMRIF